MIYAFRYECFAAEAASDKTAHFAVSCDRWPAWRRAEARLVNACRHHALIGESLIRSLQFGWICARTWVARSARKLAAIAFTSPSCRCLCPQRTAGDITGILIFKELHLADRREMLAKKHRESKWPVEEQAGLAHVILFEAVPATVVLHEPF